MEPNDESRADNQARAQMRSVAAMVAALGVDYDRLAELREERADYVNATGADDDVNDVQRADARESWAAQNPDEARELAELTEAADDCEDEDEARQRIEEDALSVEIRSGWHSPGETLEPSEFRIVLCTGGPHVELLGELDRGEPSSVRCRYADWGTSGELHDFDHDAALTYARVFCFGE